MQTLVQQKGLSQHFEIDSAGTAAYHEGQRADSRMRRHAQNRGYELTSIARKVRPEDFEHFDYIVAMDEDNYENLLDLAPSPALAQKVKRMVDFGNKYDFGGVPDPYYGTAKDFELVLDILEDATQGLLQHLQQQREA